MIHLIFRCLIVSERVGSCDWCERCEVHGRDERPCELACDPNNIVPGGHGGDHCVCQDEYYGDCCFEGLFGHFVISWTPHNVYFLFMAVYMILHDNIYAKDCPIPQYCQRYWCDPAPPSTCTHCHNNTNDAAFEYNAYQLTDGECYRM